MERVAFSTKEENGYHDHLAKLKEFLSKGYQIDAIICKAANDIEKERNTRMGCVRKRSQQLNKYEQ